MNKQIGRLAASALFLTMGLQLAVAQDGDDEKPSDLSIFSDFTPGSQLVVDHGLFDRLLEYSVILAGNADDPRSRARSTHERTGSRISWDKANGSRHCSRSSNNAPSNSSAVISQAACARSLCTQCPVTSRHHSPWVIATRSNTQAPGAAPKHRKAARATVPSKRVRHGSVMPPWRTSGSKNASTSWSHAFDGGAM